MDRWRNNKATWNTVKNQTGIQRRNFWAQVLDWPKILFEVFFFFITSFGKNQNELFDQPNIYYALSIYMV